MLDNFILLFCFTCLIYASYQDLKTRNISNNLWLFMLLIAIPFIIYNLFIFHISFLPTLLYSFFFTFTLSYFFFVLHLFGGADAKALICISLLIPSCSLSNIPFTITVLANTILISLIVVFTLFFYNLMTLPHKDFITFKNLKYWFIGYKIPISKFTDAKYTKLLCPVKENEKEVWVTPEIPFMVFITIGFVISVFWGFIIL